MPADTIRKQPPKGSSKGKIGGISWKWWAVGLVVAVGVGLYLRNKSANSTAASPASAAAPVDTSGGASGSGTGADSSGLAQSNEDLAGALNNLGYVLGGGGGVFTPAISDSFGGSPSAPTFEQPAPAAPVVSPVGATGAAHAAGVVPFSPYPGAPAGETLNLKTGIASLASGKPIVGPQKSPPSDVNPGNIVKFQVLKSGATLTTLSSGRQIEQAPGKSPYVVHK